MRAKIYQTMKKNIVGMSYQTNQENQIMKEDNKKTLDFIFLRIIKNYINRNRCNRNKFNDNSFFLFYINLIFIINESTKRSIGFY